MLLVSIFIVGCSNNAPQKNTQATPRDQIEDIIKDKEQPKVEKTDKVKAPKSKVMYLTVPDMERVDNLKVVNSDVTDNDALTDAALHVNSTGFPWQNNSNVFIASHSLGYPDTASYLSFADLNTLEDGDKIYLKDSLDRKYIYEVYDKEVVEPSQIEVMEPVGNDIISLQGCTLPDYKDRLIVRGKLVE
jgi:sortase A